MKRFNIGDKVVLDDESGTITGFTTRNGAHKYDVRYGKNSVIIALDVPEDEIEPWKEDEQ